jgi:Domain of unknown function (DUF4397)
MKLKYNLFAAFLLTALTVFVACEKNVIGTPADVVTGARVKFIHGCSNCPSLLVTANGTTINPTGMTYNSGTVGAFPTGFYASLPAGEVSLDFIRTDSSKSLFTSKVSLVDGKYYSVYIGDTVPTPTISLIEDDIKAFQDTFLRIRFVNLLSGKPKDTLELVHKNYNKVVGTNVVYGKASDFTFVQSISGIDTFFFRKVGTTVQYPLSGINTFSGGFKAQTYTLFANGVNNKTTGTQIPKLNLWRNR